MHPTTELQIKAFECGKRLIDFYISISKDHQDPTINKSTIVGDMIADLKYTMSQCFAYPLGDVESVASVALSSLQDDHLGPTKLYLPKNR